MAYLIRGLGQCLRKAWLKGQLGASSGAVDRHSIGSTHVTPSSLPAGPKDERKATASGLNSVITVSEAVGQASPWEIALAYCLLLLEGTGGSLVQLGHCYLSGLAGGARCF